LGPGADEAIAPKEIPKTRMNAVICTSSKLENDPYTEDFIHAAGMLEQGGSYIRCYGSQVPAGSGTQEMFSSEEMRLVIFTPEGDLQDFKVMISSVGKHKRNPRIMQEFPLVEAHEALEIPVEGRALGKVVISNFVAKPEDVRPSAIMSADS
jgi:D-arabinose 1-dehydrogenase-like Zn-dependent alcohol dehydrogenase